jgi:hypothetical protein
MVKSTTYMMILFYKLYLMWSTKQFYLEGKIYLVMGLNQITQMVLKLKVLLA